MIDNGLSTCFFIPIFILHLHNFEFVFISFIRRNQTNDPKDKKTCQIEYQRPFKA